MRSREGLYREYYGMPNGGSEGVVLFVIAVIILGIIILCVVLFLAGR